MKVACTSGRRGPDGPEQERCETRGRVEPFQINPRDLQHVKFSPFPGLILYEDLISLDYIHGAYSSVSFYDPYILPKNVSSFEN